MHISPLTYLSFDLTVSSLTKFYFVFTSSCFYKDLETGCNLDIFGLTSLKSQGLTFLPGSTTSIRKGQRLGQRITKSLNVKLHHDDFEMLRLANYDLSDFQNAALEANLPLGNVYVYCAPCVCAIRTALTICEEGSSRFLNYWTRVDDRISAICCPESTKIDRLILLIAAVKQIEATDMSQSTRFNIVWMELIDRVWIEQRVYQSEEEVQAQDDPRPMVASGAELFAEFQSESKETGVVILGELEHCSWMLQTQPFPWKARVPKETEIYKLAKTMFGSTWERTYLGTYTPGVFQPTANNLNGSSFPDLPRKKSKSNSPAMRRGSKPSTLRSEDQGFRQDGMEDIRQIPNEQLMTDLASSHTSNDMNDETISDDPMVSNNATAFRS